jgi:hypothetical protein
MPPHRRGRTGAPSQCMKPVKRFMPIHMAPCRPGLFVSGRHCRHLLASHLEHMPKHADVRHTRRRPIVCTRSAVFLDYSSIMALYGLRAVRILV